MSSKTILINAIFYLVLTIVLGLIIFNDKKIGVKVRNKLYQVFISKTEIENGLEKNKKAKFINLVESLGTAVILVLVIQKFYLGNFLIPTGSMEPTIMPRDRVFANMVIYNFRAPKREEIIVFKEPIENKHLYTKRLMGLPGETVQITDGHLYIDDVKIDTREYSNKGIIDTDKWIVPKKGDVIHIIPGANYKYIYGENELDVAEIQKKLMENSGYAEYYLPNMEFRVNGEKTGYILDFIHDKKYLNKILGGEIIEVMLENDYYLALGDNTDGSYDSRNWGFVKDIRIKGKALVRFWPLNRMGLVK